MLLRNAVDYTLMDELVVQYIVSNYANEARTRLQVGSTPLLMRPLYLAVRRSLPDAASIVDRFNAQLRGMIADRTYHRLLHVDWIRADVDGDGLAENVPQSDQPGKLEPSSSYLLFSTEQPKGPQPLPAPQRFYIGGNTYDGWAAVPGQIQGRGSAASRSESRGRTHLQVHVVIYSTARLEPDGLPVSPWLGSGEISVLELVNELRGAELRAVR